MQGYSRVKGASLLEIMIALLLGAIVLAEIFRVTYFLEKSIDYAALQIEYIERNNVLFAWIASDIEMAGYLGCVKAQSRESIINSAIYLPNNWLINYGNSLLSQYMSTEQFLILSKVSENEILIDGNTVFKENNIVILENCFEAQAMKIKKIKSVDYGAQKILQFYDNIQMEDLENTYVSKLVRHQYIIDHNDLYVIDENDKSNQVLENMRELSIIKNQNKFTISIIDGESNKSIILVGKSYNVN